MAISRNTKIWFHGLGCAIVTGFSTAAGAFLLMPNVFNFGGREAMANAIKIVVVPTGLAVFAYLKSSPVPALTVTTTTESTVEVTKQ